MNNIENKILYYLKTHCTGVDNAISAKQVCQAFGITDRTLRQVKRNIVLNIDYRVGSSENGYFYCSNKNELKIARSEYLSRIRKSNQMIKRYDKAIEDQEQLF